MFHAFVSSLRSKTFKLTSKFMTKHGVTELQEVSFFSHILKCGLFKDSNFCHRYLTSYAHKILVHVTPGNFSPHHRVQSVSGTHPVSYPISTGASSLGVKRPSVKLTTHLHLVPRSKNEWSYTSTPLIRLHGVVFS
jgi:hypothetical protein